jgi:hypothetical protein
MAAHVPCTPPPSPPPVGAHARARACGRVHSPPRHLLRPAALLLPRGRGGPRRLPSPVHGQRHRFSNRLRLRGPPDGRLAQLPPAPLGHRPRKERRRVQCLCEGRGRDRDHCERRYRSRGARRPRRKTGRPTDRNTDARRLHRLPGATHGGRHGRIHGRRHRQRDARACGGGHDGRLGRRQR